MMALNIAVPLTTVGDLMDGFGLLSPISPLSVDYRTIIREGTEDDHEHGKKQLVSPVGSESSGVSSLDSEEIKKPTSLPATPTKDVKQGPTANSPSALVVVIVEEATTTVSSNSCSSTRSSLSSTYSITSSENVISSEESNSSFIRELAAIGKKHVFLDVVSARGSYKSEVLVFELQ